MTIRYHLDALLTAHSTTAEAVHAATGVAESTLSKMRNNHTQRIAHGTLVKLCEHFGCTLADLMTYVPPALDSASTTARPPPPAADTTAPHSGE